MKGIPGIKEFPSDGRYWRVDWFGAIQPNPKVAREPVLQVIITPFKTTDINQLTSNKLATVASSLIDYTEQRTISIGSGQLPMLCIGSIWRDGELQKTLAGQVIDFRDLVISAFTTKVIHASAKENGHYLLPFSHYRFGSDGYFSKMVAVEYKGDPFGILIPMAELLRFYFAVSTDLVDAIFSGDLKHNLYSVINPENTWSEPDEQREVIGLRQRFTDEDGWVLARILSSPVAFEAATAVHDAMLKNRINNKPAHIECGFPFEGKTTVTAHCKPVPVEGTDQWRYLILSLARCTAAFPFRQLTIYRDNDGRQAGDEDKPDIEKQQSWPGPRTIQGNPNKPLQSQQAPNMQSATELFSLPTNRFGDIEGKEPDKPTKEQCEYKSSTRIKPAALTTQLSSAQGENNDSTTGAGRLNSSYERAKALPASFETFIKAIEYLNTLDGLSARIRKPDEFTEFIPLVKPSGCWQWSYLDSSITLKRRVLAAEIAHGNIRLLAIEFEQRPVEHYQMGTVLVPNSSDSIMLNNLLLILAHKKGVWTKVDTLGCNEIKTVKHNWTTLEKFAEAIASPIFEYIKEIGI